MAEHIIMFVLERLAELIIDEVNFSHGFKRTQIQQARTELQLMRCFLKDADARHEDERVRLWIAEIREAAYDLEDLIGTLALKVESRRKRGGRKNLVCKFSNLCIESAVFLNVGSKVEKISERISKLRLNLQKYGIKELIIIEGSESSSMRRQKELRQTYGHVIQYDVVGFEEDVEELVECLTSSEGSDVVAICGMGGLGKTTLAKMVYHNDHIRRHFDCFAWAYVSQRCQAGDVWDGILVDLMSQSMEEKKFIKEMRSHEIAKRLYEMQRERKCLVILDDIWTTHSWDCLKAAFPEHDTKSKILLTTRNKNVALKANRNCIVHEPRCLNGEQSWELLQNIIAHAQRDDTSREDNNKKFKNLGLKILKYCSGLPLAITMLGGLLSTRHTIEEWEMLEKNIETYIMKGKDHYEQLSGISWVLGLSYDELPYHLKPCFLHLSQFPEDFEIRVKELCQIWIAEGLISVKYQRQNSMETIEDASYNCLVELVERFMVQVGEWGSTGRIKTCHMHDVMRDFCLLKVEEENFLQIIKDRHDNEPMQQSFLSGTSLTSLKQTGKIRRLAICLDIDGAELLPFDSTKDFKLRSIIYFNPLSKSPLMKSIDKLFKSLSKCFYMLRVIKFENLTYVGKLPKEIGDLINLRFLSFKGGCLEMLPSSLGKLRCLQTLDLRLKNECMIPNVFQNLEDLRHLYLPHSYVMKLTSLSTSKKLLQLHNLRYLQTLVNISMQSFDIGELSNLRKLVICARDNQNLGEIFNNTKAKFSKLRSLTLHNESDLLANATPIVLICHHIYKLSLKGKILRLPKSSELSPNLIKLTLEGTRFVDDPMPMLEKLPNLRILGLFMNAFIGSKMVCSRGSFSRLESLFICALRHLNEWKVEEGALSSLRYLRIEGCIKLRTAPDGLKHLSNLKELVVKLMSSEFINRVGEGGTDFFKVQHVPSIVFLR